MTTSPNSPEARAIDYAWSETCLPDSLGDHRSQLLHAYASSDPAAQHDTQTRYTDAVADSLKATCDFAKVVLRTHTSGVSPTLMMAAAARLLSSEHVTRLDMLEGKYGIDTGARCSLLGGTRLGGPIQHLGEELYHMPVQRAVFLGNLAIQTAAQAEEIIAAVPIKSRVGLIPLYATARTVAHEILPTQLAREKDATTHVYEDWAALPWGAKAYRRGLPGWQQSLAELLPR